MLDRSAVLVTGASGFIGRHLVAALLERGDRVRALVRRQDEVAALQAAGAEVLVGDLLHQDTAARAAHGVRGVFHLAGRLFAPRVPSTYYQQLHVEATLALIEAAASAELEFFVLCTTTGVHGPTRVGTPAREADPPAPSNAYESSKAQAEVESARLGLRLHVPLVIARPGLVYGPGDLHLLGWYRAIQKGVYRVIGSGANKLHPIYVDDVVRGLLLMAGPKGPALQLEERPGPLGPGFMNVGSEGGVHQRVRAYHLVGAEAVTMSALSEAIGNAVGRPGPQGHLPVSMAYAAGALFEMLPVPRGWLPLSRSRVRFMTQNREYDGSHARDELGFVPAVGLHEGLARAVAWYRGHGLL